MMVIQSSQAWTDHGRVGEHEADPLQDWATELFAEQRGNRVSSTRAIRAQLYVVDHVQSACKTTCRRGRKLWRKTASITGSGRQPPGAYKMPSAHAWLRSLVSVLRHALQSSACRSRTASSWPESVHVGVMILGVLRDDGSNACTATVIESTTPVEIRRRELLATVSFSTGTCSRIHSESAARQDVSSMSRNDMG